MLRSLIIINYVANTIRALVPNFILKQISVFKNKITLGTLLNVHVRTATVMITLQLTFKEL